MKEGIYRHKGKVISKEEAAKLVPPNGLYIQPMGPLLPLHVRVRLADVDRTIEWRIVEAYNLEEAVKIAEAMPDVEVVLESRPTRPPEAA